MFVSERLPINKRIIFSPIERFILASQDINCCSETSSVVCLTKEIFSLARK